MRQRSDERPALGAVVRDVAAELLDGDSAASRRFIGGLIVGALVGAAVAGASLMRTQARRDTAPPKRR